MQERRADCEERRWPERSLLYLCDRYANRLINLTHIPVLFMTGEAGYHRIFDHCLARWLNQAGVQTEYVRMEDVGLTGNGHMMMLEENSAEIAEYIGGWLENNLD